MTEKGLKFSPGAVEEWLDCGNKNATVNTNQRILEFNKNEDWVSKTAQLENSVIIPPCYIGENAVIKNSVVGPHVSVGDDSQVIDSRIKNSIVQTHSKIENANFTKSMIGNFVDYSSVSKVLSIGDYSTEGK